MHIGIVLKDSKSRKFCQDLLVSIISSDRSLALSLMFPGPVSLLTILTTIGRVPAAPVDGLQLTFITLEKF